MKVIPWHSRMGTCAGKPMYTVNAISFAACRIRCLWREWLLQLLLQGN